MKSIFFIIIAISGPIAFAFSSPLQLSMRKLNLTLPALQLAETSEILSLRSTDEGVVVRYLENTFLVNTVNSDQCFDQLVPMISDKNGIISLLELPLPPPVPCERLACPSGKRN